MDKNSVESRAERFRRNYPASETQLGYEGLDTFLKQKTRDVDNLDDIDVAVLGIPYDGSVTNRPGARYGPNALRKASNWWAYVLGLTGDGAYPSGGSREVTNMRDRTRLDYSRFSMADCGDVPTFPMDVERTRESIESHVATLSERAFPVVLGGDHYCTYPSFCGFARGSDVETVGLVQIDAHSDTVGENDLFGKHFHGSSTRLVAESEHSDFEHISQVGLRAYENPDFIDFANETGLSLFPIRDVEQRGIRAVVSEAIEAAAADTDAVYVTFDIDAIDPSVAPGTGAPNPGGLTAQQAIATMEVLGESEAVEAIDLMEVAPRCDPTENTQNLGSYLLVNFLEHKFASE